MIFEKTDIFKNASLGNLSSSAEGIKMTVYYLDGMKIIATVRQYCEVNVHDKEKKKTECDLNEHKRSNPSGPLRFELLQLDTLPVESIYKLT